MKILLLTAETDRPSVDQSIHQIVVELETDRHWIGKPITNSQCPSLVYPKFAWKEVKNQ